MAYFPCWNSAYRVEVVGPDKVVLFDESNCKILEGRAFPLLVSMLDGTRELSELEDQLSRYILLPELHYALELGKAHGFILEDRASQNGSSPFWHAQGVGLGEAHERLSKRRVRILDLVAEGCDYMAAALGEFSVQVVNRNPDFTVVVTDDYLRPELVEFNAWAMESNQPWMMVRPLGQDILIGPVFRPRATGCWECLAQRLRSNRMVEAYLEGLLNAPVRAPMARLAPITRIAVDLAVTEMLKALTGKPSSQLDGRVLSFDLVAMESRTHRLVRRPQCPICGTPRDPSREPTPVVLHHHREVGQNESGHRAVTADVTYQRLKDCVSPITGVVRSLQPFGFNDSGGLTYTYAAGHNFALMNMDIHFILENMRGRSRGKGSTDVQARVSAIAETIERYSAVYRGDEPRRRASLTQLGAQALHPNHIMLFSDAQFQGRVDWNRCHASGFHQVPEPFDPDRLIDWTPVYSMRDHEFRLVPAAYCYFGHPDLKQWFFSTSDSNGNAAGNTLEEAILQGFLELVERDAVALFWYNRIARPGLDLDGVDDVYIQGLRDHYARMNRSLFVLDITSDLGIPVFACVSARLDGATDDVIVGFGAHLAPRVALMRAVTEVNQFLPAVEQRDPRGNTIYWFHEAEAIHWWRTAKLADQIHLNPNPGIPLRQLTGYEDLSSGDLQEDVVRCVAIAAERGLDTLVLDQTQPDLELSVAKVIVPGLRHFWKRFGPGRLYDAPVQLGWIDRRLEEDDLNPIGIFF